MNRRKRIARRHAIIIADIAMGIAILAMAAVVLASAVTRQRLAFQRLADSRQAVRAAEGALAELQAGFDVAHSDAETTLAVQSYNGAQAPPRRRWVEVRATVRGQSRALIGLVPDRGNAATEAAP